MNKQNGFFAIYVVLGAILMLVMVGGAFYLGTLVNNRESNQSISASTPTPVVTTKVEDNQDQFYTDSSLGISFNYPTGWYAWSQSYEGSAVVYISEKSQNETIDYQGMEDYNLISLTIDMGDIPTSVLSENGGSEVMVNPTQKYSNRNNYPIYTAAGNIFLEINSDEYITVSIGGYSDLSKTEVALTTVISTLKKLN